MFSFFSSTADKIKALIFAKRIAEEEAAREAAEKAARKKTIIIVCICAGIALVAAGIAVGIYFLSKNEKVRAKVNTIVTKVKGKLPFKKKVEELDECENCECECDLNA